MSRLNETVDLGNGYGLIRLKDRYYMSLLFFLIKLCAIPFYLKFFLKDHKTIRKIFILLNSAVVGMFLIWGVNGVTMLATALIYALQMLYAVGFMMVQFIGLFWFISRTRTTKIIPGDPKTVTWDDYRGNKPVVKIVKEWTRLLTQDFQAFKAMGGQPINGMLFVGPPGTGKTHLARAMAGSNGVAFIGTEGSDFRGMFWGMDTLKMMSFFSGVRSFAKEYGGCVGFIDEIDAVGQSRGGAMQGGQMQGGMMGGAFGGMMMNGALTRLLYEMSGIGDVSNWDKAQNKVRAFFGIPPIDPGRLMIVGSTNRPEILDPALVRAGRFDKKILVPMPDKASRRDVLEYYLGKIKHDEVDVELLVAYTPTSSPADIESAVTRDAVRRAFFEGRKAVTQRDIEDALQEQAVGLPNPISEMEPIQKRQIAIHEAGHTVLTHYLLPEDNIVRVSIVRSGTGMGYMHSVDKEDRYGYPLQSLAKHCLVSLAGHVAVEVVYGEPWTGAAGDLEQVRSMIAYLAVHGWFGIFPVNINPQMGRVLSESQLEFIEKVVLEWREKVARFLSLHRKELDALTEALLEKEDLSGYEVLKVLEEAKCEPSQSIECAVPVS